MSGLLLVNSSGKNGTVLWMEQQQASPLCGNVWLPLSIQKLLTPWSGDRLSLALVMWRLRGITPECHCLGGKWKIARGSKRTVGCKNNFFRKWCRYEYYIVLGRNAPTPGATSRPCRPNFSKLALNFYEPSVRNFHFLTPIFWQILKNLWIPGVRRLWILCDLWGYHSGTVVEASLLGYDAV